MAKVLDRSAREGDWIARWGGEEYVVGVWDSGEEGPAAERLLERAASELRENSVVLPNGERHTSPSAEGRAG